MAEPFLGEIRVVPYNFAPRNWADCNGQILPISQNTALFSLLGTTYGGNGVSNFALPNFTDRVAIHQGQGPGLEYIVLGEEGGAFSISLIGSEIPAHAHNVFAAGGQAQVTTPQDNFFGAATVANRAMNVYSGSPDSFAAAGVVSQVGGGQPHSNIQPTLGLRFVIALSGIFPQRS